MKSLEELLNQMNEITPAENTPTSSNPELEPTPLTINCFDPEFPDQPCPICKGLGVIKYAVPPDHPRFGKLYRCPNKPTEVDQARVERLRKLSNLGAFQTKTFRNFDIPHHYDEKQQQSLEIALQAAERFAHDPQGWLVLEGVYGTGKTHLAAAVGNVRLNRGDFVLFITTPDLLDYLRGTFSPNTSDTYDELFERVKNATLLILDDLGVENPSEWSKEKLFQLLNYRYSHSKPTVITTNADLDTLDPRIRSRLMDVNVIQRVILDAPDYRNSTPNEQDQMLLSRLSLYGEMTFDTFDVDTMVTSEERENLIKAAQIAEQFAHNPTNWVVFMGNFGSGKTHLAAAIANHRRLLGDEVLFLTAPDLLDYLRTTFNPNSPVTFDKLFQQIREAPLLVLDDLGTESGSSWAQEKLFQILDYRYIAHKPTIITTGKTLEELNNRIVTRLLDSRVCRIIALTAPSYAKRLKRR